MATLSGQGTDISPNESPCIGGPDELRSVPWVNVTLARLQCNGKYHFPMHFTMYLAKYCRIIDYKIKLICLVVQYGTTTI